MKINPAIIEDRWSGPAHRRHRRVTVAACGQKAKGRVKVQVLDANRNIIEDRPWQNNLILNQGLDGICSSYRWCDAFAYCAAGSGTTPTNVVSGVGNTGSGAGTTFTGPAAINFTTDAAVGDMLQMTSGTSSGTEVRITAITDATHVEYTPSGTINAGEFTIWHTAQTGLTTELKRTNNYLTGTGNCGSSFASNTITMIRTFDFTAEVGSVTYNEVGLSNTATVAANLFSRIKLASGVALTAGQALRIIYELSVTITPATTVTGATFSISGWPVAPATDTNGSYQVVHPGIAGVTTAGGTTGIPQNWAGSSLATGIQSLEPTTNGFNKQIWISPSLTAISAFTSTAAVTNRSTNATNKNSSLTTYTALDFFRDATVTFAVGEANRTDFRSMGVGASYSGGGVVGSDANGSAFVCLFDQAQTKDSLHTLTLNFRISVGRTLA